MRPPETGSGPNSKSIVYVYPSLYRTSYQSSLAILSTHFYPVRPTRFPNVLMT